MKKNFLFISIILIFILSACGGTVPAAEAPSVDIASSGSAEITSSTLTADYENALPISLQLMLGIFALEETEQAVDAGQAAEMLPLWKALRSLSQSETVAQEEISAVYKQIEETLTAEQLNAIAAMQLTREDMAGIMEEMGLTAFGPGGGFGNLTPEEQATRQAARESGEPPPGGGPGGGRPPGGPGGGEGGFQNLSPDEQATLIAERGGQRGAGAGLNGPLLDALIALLEGK